MKSFAEIDIETNGNYLKLLSAVSKLSGLFTESEIPLINYRVAENIFCKSFFAENISRSDTAFDAIYNSKGVGLKTFICEKNSIEKIAEFNKKSINISNLKNKELAIFLSEERNKRIEFANRVYNVSESLYHIVARREKELVLFETDYNKIDIANIHSVKNNKASLQFEDGNNFYSFNYSKSTLFRKFIIPPKAFQLPVEIIADPFKLLLELFEEKLLQNVTTELKKGIDYVILPLYGIRDNQKFVFEKSGLNQWNASGRVRNENEVYIPVPAEIHHKYPSFFPPIDAEKNHFLLHFPNGEIANASMCQTAMIDIKGKKVNKGKGLMTKSNKGLGDWLLRKALELKSGKLVTMEMLNKIGFDSVIITKKGSQNFKIDIMKTGTYENFNL